MGYRMPAEWHKHSATLMHWPANRNTWPGSRLNKVEAVYLDILETLTPHEPVHLLIPDESAELKIRSCLNDRGISKPAISFHMHKTDDVWSRDCGPIGIIRVDDEGKEQAALTNWGYNAWGGKYPPYDQDNGIPLYLAGLLNLPCFDVEMILEGGSIETNGSGVLLTTESVLLNPNRNPDMSKAEIERRITDYLGMEKIIWLHRGLAGDDTDGHIDDLARFVNEDTIITVVSENPDDVNYDVLQENLDLLKRANDENNHAFNIVTLPMPDTRITDTTVDGSVHVPASYANFYIANEIVLLPFYDSVTDELVREILQPYFPDREVKGIPCTDLVWGQGSIHCITQQLYGI